MRMRPPLIRTCLGILILNMRGKTQEWFSHMLIYYSYQIKKDQETLYCKAFDFALIVKLF